MQARSPKAPLLPPHPGLDVLEDEIVWNGRFPLQRIRFHYTRFDGEKSPELTWELWRRGQGVVVVPYDPATDCVALIEQFRLPALAAGLDPILTECVAGLVEPGEDPAGTGMREMQEEAGLVPRRLHPIGRHMLVAGGSDELVHFFVGEVSLPDPGELPIRHGLAAEGEDIRVSVLRCEDAFALLDANRIVNIIAALPLYWLRQHRDRLRQGWP